MSRTDRSQATISVSSSRSIGPRAAGRSACDEVRPGLRTQYETVDGSRATSPAIASIDAPDVNRDASHSRSTIRTLVRPSDGKGLDELGGPRGRVVGAPPCGQLTRALAHPRRRQRAL